jgi:hypothetical protein
MDAVAAAVDVPLLSRTLEPFAVLFTVVVDAPFISAEPSGTRRADALTVAVADMAFAATVNVLAPDADPVACAETVADPSWVTPVAPVSENAAAANGEKPSIG